MLFKPARCRFIKTNTYVARINGKSQVNIANMQRISKHYSEISYLLTVINKFYKFAWAILVNSKDNKAITAAFGQILTACNFCYLRRLLTD